MLFYTSKEVANILRFDVQTIRRKINRGEIKAVKSGKEYRIPKSEIERLMKGEK